MSTLRKSLQTLGAIAAVSGMIAAMPAPAAALGATLKIAELTTKEK